MENKLCLLIIIFVMSFFSYNVFADDTCKYSEQAKLREIGTKVDGAINFVYDEQGNASFDVVIYNIVEDVIVSVSSDSKYDKIYIADYDYSNVQNGFIDEEEPIEDFIDPNEFEDIDEYNPYNITNGNKAYITSAMADNGTFKFHVNNISEIITFKIGVSVSKDNCRVSAKTFSLVKPKRNEYFDHTVCQFEDAEDFIYCKEWITKEIKLTPKQIEQEINKKIKSDKKIEEELQGAYKDDRNFIQKNKWIIILAISFAVCIDIIYMVTKTISIKRSEI